MILGLILLLSMAVPSVAYMKGAGSMGVGIFAVSLLYIGLAAVVGVPRRSWPGAGQAIKAWLIILVIVLASSSASLVLHPQVSPGRLLGSLLFFLVFGVAALMIAWSIDVLPTRAFDRAIRFVFYVLLMAGIAGILHISPLSSIASKAVLFFNEPSHFSLSFLPFLFYMVITASPRMRQFWIIVGFAMALGLESLTLVAGTAIITVTALSTRHLLLLSPLAIGAITYLSLDYYAQRLDFSADNSNLSTLVFLSGWERAYLNATETLGLGVGFQQFGVVGNQGAVSEIIVGLFGSRLGVLDGGSVGAKFIAEFGAIGILCLIAYVWAVFRCFLRLRSADILTGGRVDPKWAFFTACFMMFSVDLFVRGIAYFSPSGLLFLAALLWLTAQGDARAATHTRAAPAA